MRVLEATFVDGVGEARPVVSEIGTSELAEKQRRANEREKAEE